LRRAPRTPPRTPPATVKPTPKPGRWWTRGAGGPLLLGSIVWCGGKLASDIYVETVRLKLTNEIIREEVLRPMPPRPRIKPAPPGPDDKKESHKCRCSARYTAREVPPPHCPDRVYATTPVRDLGLCQDLAKQSAPQECRKYYAHCSFIPR
jgi:hypothetical protein